MSFSNWNFLKGTTSWTLLRQAKEELQDAPKHPVHDRKPERKGVSPKVRSWAIQRFMNTGYANPDPDKRGQNINIETLLDYMDNPERHFPLNTKDPKLDRKHRDIHHVLTRLTKDFNMGYHKAEQAERVREQSSSATPNQQD